MPIERVSKLRAFTLIELLIVVAIIAILAAIAVPNFLEAQVRSKVSRGKTDMRSMATALEAYVIDQNHYPPDVLIGWLNPAAAAYSFPVQLSTPVAYLTSIPKNPFPNARKDQQANANEYIYTAEETKTLVANQTDWSYFWTPEAPTVFEKCRNTSHVWALVSIGPDRFPNAGEWVVYSEEMLNCFVGNPGEEGHGCIYDATNGTISEGDIVRVGP